MRTLLVLGAFDRFNYGDLLFPLIIEKRLGKNKEGLNVRYFGIQSSDLSRWGGKSTQGYCDFIKECKKQYKPVVMVAGGEVLNADWSLLVSYLERRFNSFYRLYKRVFRNRLLKLLDTLVRMAFHSPSQKPFLILKVDFENVDKIIYNAVGGPRRKLDKKKGILYYGKLASVDYISVRDQLVYDTLKEVVPGIRLVPDSAIVVSQIYSRDFLKKHFSLSLSLPKKNYIFFQVNTAVGLNNIDILTEQLREIHRKTGMDVVLCPIGTALGHEDQVPLKMINKKLGFSYFIEDPTVWDIMYLIAHSSVYIGTSLHGTITAMSFTVPYVALGREKSKLDAYIRTWGVEGMNRCTGVSRIAVMLEKALEVNEEKISKAFEKQADLAEKSFREICSLIMS